MNQLPHALALWAGLALTSPVATPVSAQTDRRPVSDTVAMPDSRGPDRLMRIVMSRRARLGIKVNLQARETDSLGAYVDAVSPGGPAAKAGLRSGDIITRIDSTSVLSGGNLQGPSTERRSLPGLRLIELAARLAPEDTVAVEYLRGKERRHVSVVTERDESFDEGGGRRMFAYRFSDPDRPGGPPRRPDGFGDRFDFPPEREFLAGSPLANLELAPLNSELGQYFGTTDGVLVVSVPKESGLGLKGGDVVTAVDGRKTASPSHLLRILRSYDRGETFKLDILRNRKRETVSAHLAGRE